MNKFLIAGLMISALAVSACTRPDRFANDGSANSPYGANGAYGAGGVGQSGLGDASDPRSTAYFAQTIGDRVLFAVDQSSVSPEAMQVLNGQAQWLSTNSQYGIVIEGHADEQGTREYNVALGARRANSVREYLISRGISANRIRTVSYGKERPVALCSDQSCYSQNRRAVTVISAGGIS
ncbi:peptidoglycan-associated lipoprotein [Ketogulonicigenium robustum]|uniref:Peptidoglycan-associated lipoprotein n=1 Tax=Ketogulonicigenium robustum TaxID=92947 RepID=A0A1W6P0Q4_9RHOB|nr:peptidoglycan-associated lipoprotein Pal [Ketogulonicigenium robustum]ARO15092.1 peptidoglycan-associated lipoprotein [Ketogulonicigenium robustum]